jgi:hypothetical protein
MGILFGASGCLLGRPGISKLSELEIDADKDWQGYGISNLKELAPSMQRGDMLQRGDNGVLEKLSPGAIGFELTSNSPGYKVEWKAPPIP